MLSATPKEGDTVTNADGGKQAHVSARMDLIPPECQLLLGECLAFGAYKYGVDNWRDISTQDHINHALVHITKWLAWDRDEPHLVNAIARLNFALSQEISTGEQDEHYNHPEARD